jgi:hypothetical protein
MKMVGIELMRPPILTLAMFVVFHNVDPPGEYLTEVD